MADAEPVAKKKDKLSARRARRAIWTLGTTAFRASPALAFTALFLVPFGQIQSQLSGLWLKMLADAVVTNDRRGAWTAAGLLATSAALSALVGVGGAKVRLTLQERVSFELDRRITELAAYLPGLEHHERPEYLDKIELLRQQRTNLGMAVGALVQNASMVLQLVVTLGLIVQLHPLLLLLPLAGIPPIVTTPIQQRRWKRVEEETAEADRLAEAVYTLATTAAPGKEVRVFNLENELSERYEAAWLAGYEPKRKALLRSNLEGTAAWLAPNLAVVAAIVFIASRAAQGLNTPGDVLLAASLAQQITGRLGSIVYMITWMMEQLRAVDRFLWLTDYAARFERTSPPAAVPDRISDGISFSGVSFTYPGVEAPSLTDVELHFPAGSVVALVGENGAGKTTLVKLLARFYEPTKGVVLVDGRPIADFDHEEWRSRIAAGFQDYSRFELVAQETVGVGLLSSIDDDEAVTAAVGRAGAADVVERLGEGLQTQLGRQWEGGVDLSGGQWQKLALGRALMRTDPLLLLLDEPTSALDAETEHALFERFADASRRNENGQITVLVSHRFSTVRMADLIVVVEGGRVVETGTHEALVASGGLYAELYGIQAAAYR